METTFDTLTAVRAAGRRLCPQHGPQQTTGPRMRSIDHDVIYSRLACGCLSGVTERWADPSDPSPIVPQYGPPAPKPRECEVWLDAEAEPCARPAVSRILVKRTEEAVRVCSQHLATLSESERVQTIGGVQ